MPGRLHRRHLREVVCVLEGAATGIIPPLHGVPKRAYPAFESRRQHPSPASPCCRFSSIPARHARFDTRSPASSAPRDMDDALSRRVEPPYSLLFRPEGFNLGTWLEQHRGAVCMVASSEQSSRFEAIQPGAH